MISELTTVIPLLALSLKLVAFVAATSGVSGL